MNINIICIGKLKEEYLRQACAEYSKRLGSFCRLSVTELTPCRLPDEPNSAQINAALEDEGKRILSKIGKGDSVISMCIEGSALSSEELSTMTEKLLISGGGTVDFIIGGSYGLSDEVKQKSALKLSMSKMTFPHQLARVMLLEQIYRAFMISSGGKYHK